MSADIKEGITFHFVENYDEVYKIAFEYWYDKSVYWNFNDFSIYDEDFLALKRLSSIF